jgi:hypothetical protein
LVVNWVDKVGVKVEVGKFVLKVLVQDHTLLLVNIAWTGISSTYAFVVNCAGNDGVSVLFVKFVLKVFVPV